ncbi:hypothetical protein BVRB_3g068120 [Beta vulgaris subsp. vulgaris]|uniref:Uncharacterized protein n=1 Tax=Beta vulgaris subsp. vulgaris TaxID=3555 RepID=A0A0J8BC24_BETVV|nr:hypothetical protein BVRB_3g068120 [Beta vulgaris subsp. vulgaris]
MDHLVVVTCLVSAVDTLFWMLDERHLGYTGFGWIWSFLEFWVTGKYRHQCRKIQ